MPSWTENDLRAFLLRGKKAQAACDGVIAEAVVASGNAELSLHNEIIEFCRAQFPRWKYIHANPAVEATIQPGAQDFTIFMPGGRVLCVECKSAKGKLSSEQQAWAFEMQKLGHTVHVVRSMTEFRALLPT